MYGLKYKGEDMSGGHFDYAQFRFNDISDELEHLILSNNDHTIDKYGDRTGRFYSEETIEKFKTAVLLCRIAFTYAHRIDYLVSGDDGEDSFHERLDEDLDKVNDELYELFNKASADEQIQS